MTGSEEAGERKPGHRRGHQVWRRGSFSSEKREGEHRFWRVCRVSDGSLRQFLPMALIFYWSRRESALFTNGGDGGAVRGQIYEESGEDYQEITLSKVFEIFLNLSPDEFP